MAQLFRSARRIVRERGWMALAKASAGYFLRNSASPYIFWQLRRSRTKLGMEASFDFAWNAGFGVIRPMQQKQEALQFLRLVEDTQPRVVMEIGTANGGNLFLLAQAATSDATIISLDLRGWTRTTGYPPWKIPLYRRFARESQRMHLVRADSHDPRTLERVKAILAGRQIDVLFIDGDHSYEGVKRDYQMYGPLVKEGGIIAFHDIVPPRPDLNIEVHRFWDEVKQGKDYREFVLDWGRGAAGIGVLMSPKAFRE